MVASVAGFMVLIFLRKNISWRWWNTRIRSFARLDGYNFNKSIRRQARLLYYYVLLASEHWASNMEALETRQSTDLPDHFPPTRNALS